MFHSCFELTTANVSNWNTESLIDTTLMFCQCYKLQVIDVSSWNTISLQRAVAMFHECGSIQSLDLSSWNTSKLNEITYVDGSTVLGLFNGCSKLETIKLPEAFIDNKITDLQRMFFGCTLLTSVNITNWDTSNVTVMRQMFDGCENLVSLDIAHWDTGNVTDMRWLFGNCTKLSSVNIDKWDVSKVNDFAYMFYRCYCITSLDLSSWITNKVINMNYMFGACKSLKSLRLDNFNFSNVTEMIDFMDSSNTELDYIKVYDVNTANKIASYLPDRTSKTTGLIECTTGSYDGLNREEVEARNWEFRILDTSYFILGKSKLGQSKLK